MNMVLLFVGIIIILLIYSFVLTYLYTRRESEENQTLINDKIDYKLDQVKKRMRVIKRETPSFIEIDIKNRDI